MNRKIKLSLLGAMIAGSSLAVTLPLVSCGAVSEKEVCVNTACNTVITHHAQIGYSLEISYHQVIFAYEGQHAGSFDRFYLFLDNGILIRNEEATYMGFLKWSQDKELQCK